VAKCRLRLALARTRTIGPSGSSTLLRRVPRGCRPGMRFQLSPPACGLRPGSVEMMWRSRDLACAANSPPRRAGTYRRRGDRMEDRRGSGQREAGGVGDELTPARRSRLECPPATSSRTSISRLVMPSLRICAGTCAWPRPRRGTRSPARRSTAPDGGLIALGSSPLTQIPLRALATSGWGTGIAAMRPAVYGRAARS
jgi:hypothetical protein